MAADCPRDAGDVGSEVGRRDLLSITRAFFKERKSNFFAFSAEVLFFFILTSVVALRLANITRGE
jgi:hypothetical protein